MAGIKITHRITGPDAVALFDRLARLGRDATPVFADIGEQLLRTTEGRFREEKDPAGNPWAPNAPATLRSKRHPKVLTESGRLRGSIAYQAGGTKVEVGTNVVYGGIHQKGGKAGRGRKVSIPRREYLGVSAEDQAAINAIVRDHLERALEP